MYADGVSPAKCWQSPALASLEGQGMPSQTGRYWVLVALGDTCDRSSFAVVRRPRIQARPELPCPAGQSVPSGPYVRLMTRSVTDISTPRHTKTYQDLPRPIGFLGQPNSTVISSQAPSPCLGTERRDEACHSWTLGVTLTCSSVASACQTTLK